MDVVFSVCIVTRGAVDSCSCMGSISVSSCRCCTFCLFSIMWQFSMLHSA